MSAPSRLPAPAAAAAPRSKLASPRPVKTAASGTTSVTPTLSAGTSKAAPPPSKLTSPLRASPLPSKLVNPIRPASGAGVRKTPSHSTSIVLPTMVSATPAPVNDSKSSIKLSLSNDLLNDSQLPSPRPIVVEHASHSDRPSSRASSNSSQSSRGGTPTQTPRTGTGIGAGTGTVSPVKRPVTGGNRAAATSITARVKSSPAASHPATNSATATNTKASTVSLEAELIKALTESHTALQATVGALTLQLSVLQSQHSESLSSIEKKTEDLYTNVLQQRAEEKQTRIKSSLELASNINTLIVDTDKKHTAAIQSLEDKLELLANTSDSNTKEWKIEIENVNARINNFESELASVHIHHDTVSASVEALKLEHSALLAMANDNKSKTNNCVNDLIETRRKLGELTEGISGVSQRYSELKQSQAALVTALESKITEHVQSLRDELVTVQQQYDRLDENFQHRELMLNELMEWKDEREEEQTRESFQLQKNSSDTHTDSGTMSETKTIDSNADAIADKSGSNSAINSRSSSLAFTPILPTRHAASQSVDLSPWHTQPQPQALTSPSLTSRSHVSSLSHGSAPVPVVDPASLLAAFPELNDSSVKQTRRAGVYTSPAKLSEKSNALAWTINVTDRDREKAATPAKASGRASVSAASSPSHSSHSQRSSVSQVHNGHSNAALLHSSHPGNGVSENRKSFSVALDDAAVDGAESNQSTSHDRARAASGSDSPSSSMPTATSTVSHNPCAPAAAAVATDALTVEELDDTETF